MTAHHVTANDAPPGNVSREPAGGGVTPEELDSTAAAWTVLATAYGKVPEERFVTAMRSADQLTHWPYQDRQSVTGIELLIRSGRTATQGRAGEDLADIIADHRRLFIGPRPLHAAPWESVYRSREGLVFEAQTIAVRQAYRRFGLQAPRLNEEPDDHIALEASFISTLCVRALEALAEGRHQDATRFIDGVGSFATEHLRVWLPEFLDRVDRYADTDYHLGIAALTRGALHHLPIRTAPGSVESGGVESGSEAPGHEGARSVAPSHEGARGEGSSSKASSGETAGGGVRPGDRGPAP